jgi:hypothetical protein
LLEYLRHNPRFGGGVGFVLTANDPFCAIDLDDCLSDSGALKPWAVALLKRFANCWVEKSVSGGGLHIWCEARAPYGVKRQLADGAIEIYSSDRFMIVTGDHFADSPLELPCHQADVDLLLAHFGHATGSRSLRTSSSASSDGMLNIGERYPKFLQVAGALRRHGACLQVVEAAIRALNTHQCLVPKTEFELDGDLRKILASAQRW